MDAVANFPVIRTAGCALAFAFGHLKPAFSITANQGNTVAIRSAGYPKEMQDAVRGRFFRTHVVVVRRYSGAVCRSRLILFIACANLRIAIARGLRASEVAVRASLGASRCSCSASVMRPRLVWPWRGWVVLAYGDVLRSSTPQNLCDGKMPTWIPISALPICLSV